MRTRLILLSILAFASACDVRGADADRANQAAEEVPAVVELFTSQSCSSCPPAEAILGRLAAKPNVIALEWHVDYWNRLDVGAAGRWKDPYSSAAHTERQNTYNRAIRGTDGVYTPQAVVNGIRETSGSNAQHLADLIRLARRDSPVTAAIATRNDTDIGFTASLPAGLRANAFLVSFKRSAFTRVKGGENNGRELPEVNVVRDIKDLGPAKPGVIRFAVAIPAQGDNCALLIQEKASGRILSAGYCTPYQP